MDDYKDSEVFFKDKVKRQKYIDLLFSKHCFNKYIECELPLVEEVYEPKFVFFGSYVKRNIYEDSVQNILEKIDKNKILQSIQ